jgi:pyrroline-5-carboxylate reductase
MNTPLAIGFLGAGQMATALARGWLAAGLLDAGRSLAADPDPAARVRFNDATGLRAVATNSAVLGEAGVIVLAVKPQVIAPVLAEVRPLLRPAGHLVVSIAAGVTLRQLADGLGPDARVIRVMPNTPALVGAAASAFSSGPAATADDSACVQTLFEAIGRAVPVPEHLLDAVTGLSGSGPAYVAVLIEALADGGVRMGLPRDVALSLAAQTALGTAKLILETDRHPAQVKDAVASPGGTTIAGLHALEKGGVRAALMDAVEAATRRAVELGRLND